MAALTYMGTKKRLSRTIGVLCERLPPGPFLDLFSGISAAGASIAPQRQIWCNDAQVFSRALTEALYSSKEKGPRVNRVAAFVQRLGIRNLELLINAAKTEVKREFELLHHGSSDEQITLQQDLLANCQERRSDWEENYSHCLFSTRYAGSYLGLVQAMQIDSIRYGADTALNDGLISTEEHRWALLALCRSIAATSNSTGHFAQYLTASRKNISRVVGKRRRCSWAYWLSALTDLQPIGTSAWRAANRVFHGDAIEVLSILYNARLKPAIIYADPPYTKDQYSRYYHLLETAILYDYPLTLGKGLYRQDRFRSTFSLAREVEASFQDMIAGAAKVGSSLMISYPNNGLLPSSLERIPSMMARYFRNVEEPTIIPHRHSTLGASKGREKEDVEECIFIATCSL